MPTQNPNPPEDSSSNWIPHDFSEDDVSLAYFAYDSRQANGEDGDGSSSSNESSTCSCVVSVAVNPVAVCYCDGAPDCDDTVIAGAATSCKGEQVFIISPDGNTASASDVVDTEYKIRKQDAGTYISFIGYEPHCDTTSTKSIPVFIVGFTIESFWAKMLIKQQIGARFYRIPETGHSEKLEFDGAVPTGNASTFSSEIKVRINTQPRPNEENEDEKDIADGCCAQWELACVQNILCAGSIITTYEHETITETWSDKPSAYFDTASYFPFLFENDVEICTLNDSPGTNAWVFGPDGTNKHDLLSSIEVKDTVFYTWFFVRRKLPDGTAKEESKKFYKFLRWVKWAVAWRVEIRKNEEGRIVYHYTRKRFEIIDQGQGMGTNEPVGEPFIKDPDFVKTVITHH